MSTTKSLTIGGASVIRGRDVVISHVWDRSAIEHADLLSLLDGTSLALRIKDYYPEAICRSLAETLLQSGQYGRYINAPEIGRVGQAFFESQADVAAKRRYQAKAVCWIRELRDAFGPKLTPIDRLRLELDEVWPQGAMLASMSGYKMFAGLARHFAEGSPGAEPHQDVLAWDAPDSRDAQDVRQQITANIYLNVADQGGELAIWKQKLSREQYELIRNPGSYGLQEQRLGPPDLVIKPAAGDLILFDAGNIHSVKAIQKGSRVTWSAFIGYSGEVKPLIFWS